jgi:pimeloyl-ACP methyl ester carboxylesterase
MKILCRLAIIAGFSVSLGGCYTLSNRDLFEVSFAPLSQMDIRTLSDDNHHIRPLHVSVGDRVVSAYVDESPDAQGTLIFFDGNGYGAKTALKTLLARTRARHLDLLVFNYYDQGQSVPEFTVMRRISQALVDKAASLPGKAGEVLFAGGHSLGATFALDIASDPRLTASFVAAPATTGVAMIHHQLWYSRFAWLRQTDDYRNFNDLQIAAKARVPVIVFGADGDRDLPPHFTDKVFAALPGGLRKREVILTGIDHTGYLTDDKLWTEVDAFFWPKQ